MKITLAATVILTRASRYNPVINTSFRKALTSDGARGYRGSRRPSGRKQDHGVIAVVDEGGNLMALERLDGTFAAGANMT